MSDKELENIVDDEALQDEEQLDEFKATGEPSEVPDPVAMPSNKRKADKDQGDKAMPKLPGTRLGMINAMMNVMSGMKREQLTAMYDGMVGKNQASIKAKGDAKSVKMEDVEEMFAGEQLTEEFKDRAVTIFEAAVAAKIAEQTVRLEEEFEARFEEEINEAKTALNERADEYLSYVAEEWLKENKVAVESGIRTEVAESFMEGLKNLFVEHYFDIPEDRVDIVQDLSDKVSELEEKHETSIAENMDLKKELDKFRKEAILAQVAEELTATEKEKLATLASGISYENLDEFATKLDVVKENYFRKSQETVQYDEEIEVEEQKPGVDPQVASYLDAISRTVKK